MEWVPLAAIIVTLLLAGGGVFAGWFAFRIRNESLPKRFDQLYQDFNAFKVHVSDNYVKESDLHQFEARIAVRFDDLRAYMRELFKRP